MQYRTIFAIVLLAVVPKTLEKTNVAQSLKRLCKQGKQVKIRNKYI